MVPRNRGIDLINSTVSNKDAYPRSNYAMFRNNSHQIPRADLKSATAAHDWERVHEKSTSLVHDWVTATYELKFH